MDTKSPPRDAVIDENLPKAEQERRVQEEIQKSDEELFGGKTEKSRKESRR